MEIRKNMTTFNQKQAQENYEPNGIYGKGKESKFEIQFYSNKLNNSNEYSLYKY